MRSLSEGRAFLSFDSLILEEVQASCYQKEGLV